MRFGIRKQIILALVVWPFYLALSCTLAFAGAQDDDFAAFADEMAAEMKAFEDEQAAEVDAFIEEADRDFLEFLRDAWKDLEEFDGIPSPLKPKPQALPKAPEPVSRVPDKTPTVELPPPPSAPAQATAGKGTPASSPTGKGAASQASPDAANPTQGTAANLTPNTPQGAGPQASQGTVASSKGAAAKLTPNKAAPNQGAAQTASSKAAPASVKQTEAADERLKVSFDWMGQPLQFRCDEQSRYSLRGEVNPEAISAFWEHQARIDQRDLLEQLQGARQALLLNDWGYVKLVYAYASALQPGLNEANLHSWFLLTKSGFRARLGYGDGKAYLLAAAGNTIYGVPYYTVKGVRYYNLSYMDGQPRPHLMRSYDGEYRGADNDLDLHLVQIPLAGAEESTRDLTFKYGGKTFHVPVTFSQKRVDFFHAYPQTDIPIFFQAAVSESAERSLVGALAPLIKGRTEKDAVNLLLRFVQTSFEYQTDHQQFGREKYLFVEETLRFPYSDCEDRSIIFSYLVKRLIGLDVVALKYPNHIATAVHFNGPVEGTSVTVQGKRFVVCDPTYINAGVGMEMPQFKEVTPEVMAL